MNPRFATSLLSTLTTCAANDACAPAIYACAVSVRLMGASNLCMCGLCSTYGRQQIMYVRSLLDVCASANYVCAVSLRTYLSDYVCAVCMCGELALSSWALLSWTPSSWVLCIHIYIYIYAKIYTHTSSGSFIVFLIFRGLSPSALKYDTLWPDRPLLEDARAALASFSGRNWSGSIRFGSVIFEKSSFRFGSVWQFYVYGSMRFGLRFLNALWLGPVRFGSFPRPVPAGSRIKRFGSVRPVRFGFLLLPDVTNEFNKSRPLSMLRSVSIISIFEISIWESQIRTH